MNHQQTLLEPIAHPTISNSAPVGNVGIDFHASIAYLAAGWRKMQLTITVSGGASDVFLWTRRAVGVSGDATDDVWGLFQDMFGIIKLGKLATALPVGTYHFVIPDVGGFAGLYVQSSANTVVATVAPIQELS